VPSITHAREITRFLEPMPTIHGYVDQIGKVVEYTLGARIPHREIFARAYNRTNLTLCVPINLFDVVTLNSKLVTPTAPPCLEHIAAALGSHPLTKTVNTSTAADLGLICSLGHFSTPTSQH
jgi:hypothetical protein